MKHLCILLIRIYQWAVAPVKRLLCGGSGTCRYDPSCSRYAINALQYHGFFKGLTLGVLRVLRCHPWGGFGVDEVPSRAPWMHILGFRLGADAWTEHARAINGAVLVCRDRFVSEGGSPAAALDAALQGSRGFDGGKLYTVARCSEDTLTLLSEHRVAVTTDEADS